MELTRARRQEGRREREYHTLAHYGNFDKDDTLMRT